MFYMKQPPEVFFNNFLSLKILQISQENRVSIKKRIQHKCFPVKFEEILKSANFEEHLRTTAFVFLWIRLLLKWYII